MTKPIQVTMRDAYALALLGQVPPDLKQKMYDKYISLIDVSEVGQKLIDEQLGISQVG